MELHHLVIAGAIILALIVAVRVLRRKPRTGSGLGGDGGSRDSFDR
jgi:hypothetical protein